MPQVQRTRRWPAEVVVGTRISALVLVGVEQDRLADLTQVARAFHTIRRLTGTIQRRQQDRDQQRDDADNDQQFDQGKTLVTILIAS